MDDLLTSPLHDRHVALGATLGAFGGWSMPISYPDGTVAEHTAVREAVGVFDVSHLGKLAITGPGAAEFVNRCFTADLAKIGPGHAQYTLCCTDTGGVVDDIIVYLVGPDEVLAVPNAANAAQVAQMLRAAAPEGVAITDRHRELAVVAVQGPLAGALHATMFTGFEAVSDLDYMAFGDAGAVRVCRTGYTGERGYELVPAWEVAGELWDALVEAAAPFDGMPCGLGARDTLRTEMGYALHGNELSPSITPVQARVGWAVGWKKDAFWGKDALTAERAEGPARVAWGLLATGRGIPRAHCEVRLDGEVVGEVTSGTFSPTLKNGIALALLSPSVTEGTEVVIDVRGRDVPARVVKPPFVEVDVREG